MEIGKSEIAATEGDPGEIVTGPPIIQSDGTPLNTVDPSAVSGALKAFKETDEQIRRLFAKEPQSDEAEPDATAD